MAVRRETPKKKTNLTQPSKRIYLPYIIAALAAAFSFLPALGCCQLIIPAFLYAGVFAWLFFTEKMTRKTDRTFQENGAYLSFLVLSVCVPLTGGYASVLKWALFILAFALCARKLYVLALLALSVAVLSVIKSVVSFTAQDYFVTAATGIFILVSYLNKRENFGIREKIVQAPTDAALNQGATPEHFGRVASAIVNKLLDSYAEVLKADSLMFYLRNQADENIFDMTSFFTVHKNHFNANFRIEMGDSVLGTALSKGTYFEFSPNTAMPYYLAQNIKSEKAAIVPVVLNKMIGAIVIDFNEKTAGQLAADDLRRAMTSLASELASLIELFEMNQRLIYREKRVSTLYDIYAKLNLLEGKAGLIKRLFAELAGFDITSAYIAELNLNPDEMTIVQTHNYPKEVTGKTIVIKEDGLINYALTNLKPSVTAGASGRTLPANYGNNSIDHFVIFPIAIAGEVLGILKLDRETGEKFTEFEMKTFEMIVSRVAMLLENAKLYEKIQRQATRDGLTGLMNHVTFQEKLQEAIDACDSGRVKCVSLFLTDIDFFKKFNDSFGHQEGDRVLKKTAAMLMDYEKKFPGTFAARYGGEEFVFVTPGYDLKSAAGIAESIRKFCAENLKGGNETEVRAINLSIGVSTYPEKSENGRDMIKTADEALYKAKKEGRNRVVTV